MMAGVTGLWTPMFSSLTCFVSGSGGLTEPLAHERFEMPGRNRGGSGGGAVKNMPRVKASALTSPHQAAPHSTGVSAAEKPR